jgi:ferredoxin/flavodoxin---NADP+ reductase
VDAYAELRFAASFESGILMSDTTEVTEINPDDIFDIAIIGGGPVGLYTAYYAGLRGMKVKVIDSLAQLGGQLTALYPEKYIFDVAGFPKVYAKDLVDNLVEQMSQYNPTVALEQKVVNLVSEGELVTLETERGVTHYAKSVVITAGVGAFTPRKLDLENFGALEGKGIHYFVTDKSRFAGKRLMIVGGGDSAFDWALNLHGVAESITLIHRTDKFRAHEDTVVKVLELPVNIKTFHEVKEIHGDDYVSGLTIYHNKTKEEEFHEIDEVLMTLGFITNLGPIKQWGLDIAGNAIKVNSRMETSIPRVYAAGDIVDYEGKLKLIATGFGEAAIAANHAKALVDPHSKVNPGHSSENVPEKK